MCRPPRLCRGTAGWPPLGQRWGIAGSHPPGLSRLTTGSPPAGLRWGIAGSRPRGQRWGIAGSPSPRLSQVTAGLPLARLRWGTAGSRPPGLHRGTAGSWPLGRSLLRAWKKSKERKSHLCPMRPTKGVIHSGCGARGPKSENRRSVRSSRSLTKRTPSPRRTKRMRPLPRHSREASGPLPRTRGLPRVHFMVPIRVLGAGS